MTIQPLHNSPLPVLVFTDLDGTLLDHDTYEFAAALPTLKLLQSLNIPLIPTTSKTVAEILQINQRLNNQHPFIAENGCIIGMPEAYFSDAGPATAASVFTAEFQPYTLLTLAPLYADVVGILQSLRDDHGFRFQGFNDMTACEIAKLTQLPLPKAELAKQRLCSEPLLWLGDESGLAAFKRLLQQHQLQLVKGGRFWHVFGLTNKGLAMQQLIDIYHRHELTRRTVIALGDSPNDIDMLDKAEIAIVIKHKDGTQLDYGVNEHANGRLLVSGKPGPAGWNTALSAVLAQLQTNTVDGKRHV